MWLCVSTTSLPLNYFRLVSVFGMKSTWFRCKRCNKYEAIHFAFIFYIHLRLLITFSRSRLSQCIYLACCMQGNRTLTSLNIMIFTLCSTTCTPLRNFTQKYRGMLTAGMFCKEKGFPMWQSAQAFPGVSTASIVLVLLSLHIPKKWDRRVILVFLIDELLTVVWRPTFWSLLLCWQAGCYTWK